MIIEQPNAHDCGVYALANATELAHNCDPAVSLGCQLLYNFDHSVLIGGTLPF